jgi:hypothetical protein
MVRIEAVPEEACRSLDRGEVTFPETLRYPFAPYSARVSGVIPEWGFGGPMVSMNQSTSATVSRSNRSPVHRHDPR